MAAAFAAIVLTLLPRPWSGAFAACATWRLQHRQVISIDSASYEAVQLGSPTGGSKLDRRAVL